jgi:hypothetical protein
MGILGSKTPRKSLPSLITAKTPESSGKHRGIRKSRFRGTIPIFYSVTPATPELLQLL